MDRGTAVVVSRLEHVLAILGFLWSLQGALSLAGRALAALHRRFAVRRSPIVMYVAARPSDLPPAVEREIRRARREGRN